MENSYHWYMDNVNPELSKNGGMDKAEDAKILRNYGFYQSKSESLNSFTGRMLRDLQDTAKIRMSIPSEFIDRLKPKNE